MPRRARSNAKALVALATFAAALAACNLIAGLTEDYSVVSGDGSTPSGEAGGDGPVDPDGAKDGSPNTDGGQDGTITPDALPPARYCDSLDASGLDFCHDFEDDTLGVMPTWSRFQKDLGTDASIEVSAEGGLGGSRGLVFETYTASTGNRNTFLVETLAATKQPGDFLSYDIEFDFLVVASLPDEAVGVLNFTGATPEDHGVAAYSTLDLASKLAPKGTAPGVKLGSKWHHVRISLEHTAPGTMFNKRIAIDGEMNVDTATVSVASASATEVRIGVFSTAGSGRTRVLFDNVVAWRR